MTAAEASAVWRRVFASMDIWEQDVGDGSARPAFVTAWAEATRTVPLVEPWTAGDREACWKAWLGAGKDLTPERAQELLERAYAREAARRKPREPGEEG